MRYRIGNVLFIEFNTFGNWEKSKLKKGSGEPNRQKVGKVTWDQVKEIAEDKMADLNAFKIESAMKIIAGTARSMGINVAGNNPFEKKNK